MDNENMFRISREETPKGIYAEGETEIDCAVDEI